MGIRCFKCAVDFLLELPKIPLNNDHLINNWWIMYAITIFYCKNKTQETWSALRVLDLCSLFAIYSYNIKKGEKSNGTTPVSKRFSIWKSHHLASKLNSRKEESYSIVSFSRKSSKLPTRKAGEFSKLMQTLDYVSGLHKGLRRILLTLFVFRWNYVNKNTPVYRQLKSNEMTTGLLWSWWDAALINVLRL